MAKNIFTYKKPAAIKIPKLKTVKLKPIKMAKGAKARRPSTPSARMGGVRNKFGVVLSKHKNI